VPPRTAVVTSGCALFNRAVFGYSDNSDDRRIVLPDASPRSPSFKTVLRGRVSLFRAIPVVRPDRSWPLARGGASRCRRSGVGTGPSCHPEDRLR
jgi:hypothetical protein